MSRDPLLALVAFRQEVPSFQRRSLDAPGRALEAGKNMVLFQKAAHEAGMVGAEARTMSIELWTPTP